MSRRVALLICAAATGCTAQPELHRLDKSRVAPPPEKVHFEIDNYTPPSNRRFRDLFVRNFSVKVDEGELLYSTARDGFSDDEKRLLTRDYGFVYDQVDGDGNGFSDLTMYLAGVLLPQQGALFCAGSAQVNTANDSFVYNDPRLPNPSGAPGGPLVYLGLRDCEKAYLALDARKFDNDADGLPDYLELLCGLNPKNPNDVYLMPTGDAVTNMEKCKRQIPLNEDAHNQPNQLFAHKYRTEVDLTGKHKFYVNNVPVLRSGADNFVAFYLTEYDSANNRTVLYTAFVRLKAGADDRVFKFDFWGTGPYPTNAEILVP
jgi:hypothetical protein